METKENYRLVGAYRFNQIVLVTIQHKLSKDVYQSIFPASNEDLKNCLMNGLEEGVIDVVLKEINNSEVNFI